MLFFVTNAISFPHDVLILCVSFNAIELGPQLYFILCRITQIIGLNTISQLYWHLCEWTAAHIQRALRHSDYGLPCSWK